MNINDSFSANQRPSYFIMQRSVYFTINIPYIIVRHKNCSDNSRLKTHYNVSSAFHETVSNGNIPVPLLCSDM